MAVIVSAGELARVDRPTYTWGRPLPSVSLALHNSRRRSYAEILRYQPNVRTVISFIARNIAQLGVQTFDRVSDTDRERITDHPFVDAIKQPNPLDRHLTTYRLMHRTVWDICAYDVAFWSLWEVDGLDRPVIIPLRPDRTIVHGHHWPTGFEYQTQTGQRLEFGPERIVYFQNSHDLEDPLAGVSPIETLHRIIAEEEAAGHYREQFWRSGARVSGVIERPVEAPAWSPEARTRFRTDWSNAYTGHGDQAGGTPILEDGMKWTEAGSTDARSAQYIEARKLSREEAAAVYHVDPIWVGIAQAGLSFSSVKERHKALYQDTLGPWVVMLEQDLTYQALPAFDDSPSDKYVKLNIAEKMRGSIDDLAESIFKLTGRPVLTGNEGRALLDRNDLPEGEGLIVPLNVQLLDGQQSTDIVEVPAEPEEAASRRGAKAVGPTEDQHEAVKAAQTLALARTLRRHFSRQETEVLSEFGAGLRAIADLWDTERWDTELETDLLALALGLAGAYGPLVAESLGLETPNLDAQIPFLAESSRIAAENINATTRDQVADALGVDEPLEDLRGVFDRATGARADQAATTRFTALAAFVAADVASQAGRSEKVWTVTSSNSRHPELDGESVPLGEPFSNGLQYPGDPTGGVDQVAGCTCLLSFQ